MDTVILEQVTLAHTFGLIILLPPMLPSYQFKQMYLDLV